MKTTRRGLTIIELLVSMSIIGMLMALLLPAVMRARSAARRNTCANNLRNVGLAVLGQTAARGRFPAAGNFGTGSQRYHSWVVPVLPFLERSDVHARWKFSETVDSAANQPLARVAVSVLACPDDWSVEPKQGNLSYAVNCGAGFTVPIDSPATYRSALGLFAGPHPFDLNGNGVIALTPASQSLDGHPSDRDLLWQMSLFFIENWPPGTGSAARYHSLDDILDGGSQTIMLAESVRAGYDPYTGAGWAWPEPYRNGFFLSGHVCQNASCSPGNVNYARANQRSGGPWRFEAINAALGQAEGEAPWPSSGHVAGVQASFVDGHARFLSEDIEGAVYAALVTPRGTQIAGPLAQSLVDDGSF